MARRDDPQPQAPDIGELVHENADYTLTGEGDPLDAGWVPPDRPIELDGDTVTPAGARAGESHDDRLARELSDDAGPTDAERAGRLVAEHTDAGGGAVDDNDAVEVGVDGGAASAEEAAVHRTGGDPLEPVVDDSPVGDPEVAAQLDDGPRAEQAERDAHRDAEGDPIAGRDEEHRDPGGVLDRAAGIDAVPDAAGAAAAASGRDDAGPDGRLS
ncbi:hypothetical protein Psed_2712 [Pseudonocardia dioxanivorans CB1190]|uniref:DUF5709 domain-containing protein n=1 Tax=Pseudonocardia dioxanivorans (strain ATCC 55486 / DSM 44775 / JCM 13855 / CB1190) TaxID=675635 RepID=F4CJG1_PSEUX|nr:DUF5709 domain-containing protein [Pseudonocardia dioxanivorans]AEA24913.1 hypothetical protein Psed_2712 [Pseudonocardia dioxanivorans CB1190]